MAQEAPINGVQGKGKSNSNKKEKENLKKKKPARQKQQRMEDSSMVPAAGSKKTRMRYTWGSVCEHGGGTKSRQECRWWTQNMGRRGGTSRASRRVLCVEGCCMLRYAKHIGLRGFVGNVLLWVGAICFFFSGNKK